MKIELPERGSKEKRLAQNRRLNAVRKIEESSVFKEGGGRNIIVSLYRELQNSFVT